MGREQGIVARQQPANKQSPPISFEKLINIIDRQLLFYVEGKVTLGFGFLLIDFGGLESDLQGEEGVAHFLHVRVSGPLRSGGIGLV